MTIDELPRRTPEQAALDDYHHSIRLRRRIYAGIIVVLVVAAAIIVRIAFSHGEISHATLHTAAQPLPSPAPRAISPTPQQTWRTSDSSAIGTAIWGGTVVTYGPRTVRGRDALTGEITWSYTRTDRTVCTAIQTQGVTIAVFRLKGNCDQLTAFESETGKRKWFRTLDKDNQPLYGTPTYSVGDFTVLITTPGVIYAVDPNGGLDRWTFAQKGCSIHSAVLGSQGALISQTCTEPSCDGLTFCGPGDQLLLRDATAGRSDDDKNKANPDQIKWDKFGSRPLVPVSADKLISAADPVNNALSVFEAKKGATLADLSLSGTTATAGALAQQETADAELIWVGGVTYSVRLTDSFVNWSAPTTGPPVAVPTPGRDDDPVDLANAVLLVATATGVDSLTPSTGAIALQYPIEAPPPNSRALPFSSGFLVVGAATVAYR